MIKTKLCPKCSKRRRVKNFDEDKSTSTGYSCWCKGCRAKSAKARYEKNRDVILKKMREEYRATHGKKSRAVAIKARDRYRTIWNEYLPGNGTIACSRCGYSKCFAAIDFHHLRDKKFSISAMMNHKPTPERIKLFVEELEKCIVLCANCHREHHFNK